MLPNDEREQERMDLHHHVFRLTLGGRLTRAPIPSEMQRVLDLGTGTGIWAIDFADEYPSAVVIGNDLSPIQPAWVPANCKFIVDDIESDWVYPPGEKFDYIHGRGLGGSIRDWDRLYSQIYENLNPGGWLEMQEYEAWISSDDDPMLLNSPATARWQELVDLASLIFGKKVNIADSVEQRFIKAGFEDVRDDVYKVCFSEWWLLGVTTNFVRGSHRDVATRSKAQDPWAVSTRADVRLCRALHLGSLNSNPEMEQRGDTGYYGASPQ